MSGSFIRFVLVILFFQTFCQSGVGLPGSPVLTGAENVVKSMKIEIIKKVALPKGYHEGLTLDDGKLMVCNGRGIGTWVIDIENKKMEYELEPFGSFTESLKRDGKGDFWITDWDEKKLYRVSIEGRKISSDFNVSLSPAHPVGMVFAEEKLHVITWTRGIGGTKYHILRFNENGELLDKRNLKGISEPSQLTWDGHFLWITSWYNQKVFKVDVDALKILGYFKSPAKKTTGIEWNGKDFWITGTYDDLYLVRVTE